MRLAVLCSILLCSPFILALPAHGGESLRVVYDALERSVDLDDAASVAAARASLQESSQDWLESVLPGGPLRGRLASSFTPEEVRALLRRAQREEGERTERLAAVIENLAVRPDLAALLSEEGVFTLLLPTNRNLLFDVASIALVQGDQHPMVLLLREPAGTEKMAEALASLNWSVGLRTLADAVTGSISLPDEALAHLGRAEPDLQNVNHRRPLGVARIKALEVTARSASDPALRAVAARVLLRSSTADAFEATVAAYTRAHTIHLAEDEWWRVGRLFDRLVLKSSVPRWARLQALRGTMQFAGLSVRNDPEDAEVAAQRLRAWLAEERDPLMRGMLLRELPRMAYYFVDMGARQKLAVPSYRGLLADLLHERPGEEPLLRDLSTRTAKGLLHDLESESAPHWRRDKPLPKRRPALPPALRSLDAAALARQLAGVEGSDQDRALLADAANNIFGVRTGGILERAVAKGGELDLTPDVIAGLTQVLAEHPDPQAVWLAGELLNLAGAPAAFDALLKHAERRWNGDIDEVPSVEATRHIRSLLALERALSFIEDAARSPWIRLELAEALLSLEWSEGLSPALRKGAFSHLLRWVVERAPLLDAGLAEVVLETWAGTEADAETEEDEALIGRTLREAIARVPTKGPRLRLQTSLLR